MSPVDPYDIVLHLTLPATQANYDLGNFMTTLSLNATKTKALANVRKSVRAPLRRQWYSLTSHRRFSCRHQASSPSQRR
jgi:hypothetical protein